MEALPWVLLATTKRLLSGPLAVISKSMKRGEGLLNVFIATKLAMLMYPTKPASAMHNLSFLYLMLHKPKHICYTEVVSIGPIPWFFTSFWSTGVYG